MLSRREMVTKLAAGAAAACAVGAAGSALASTRGAAAKVGTKPVDGPAKGAADAAASIAERHIADELPKVVDAGPPATLQAPAPWDMIRPLTVGSSVGYGWHVAALTGAVDGSCVLTLQNERGRSHRVHLCRNDGRPQGLVYTKQIDMVVMNGGQGDLPTEEGFAQAVAEVGHVLAKNESNMQHASVVAALLPQAERVNRFVGDAERRLR